MSVFRCSDSRGDTHLVSVLVLELVRMDKERLLTVVTLDVCFGGGVRNVQNVVWTVLLALKTNTMGADGLT